MSTPAEGRGLALRLALRPFEWRLPRIDTWPAVVSFTQTWVGRLVLFSLFAGLMKLAARGLWIESGWMWLLITIAAAIVSVAGRYRALALLACTAALLVHWPGWYEFRAVHMALRQEHLNGAVNVERLRAGTLIVCAALAILALWLTRRYREHPLARRPVLAQHVLCFCLLGVAAADLLRGLPQVVFWSATATFLGYFWFLAYALMDQRHRQAPPLLHQLATFNPFAWSTTLPMGRGWAQWHSVEAGAAEDLAVTQLKAVKLLVWALILKVALWGYRGIVYDQLGVTRLGVAFEEFLRGAPTGPSGILSVVANFPEQLLILSVWGHVVIATARLAGFRLLRNTCRPLEARTIADFWNRYFYYFKELLVHIYFYPTYLRWFKRHPRLRLAFATFMAAGFGNFLFHFLWENHNIAQYGLKGALVRYQTYAFYCLLLAGGIVLSQLRARPPRAGWLRGRVLPTAGVMAFFCFLSFFDGPQRHVDLWQHFTFLIRIMGLG